MYKFGRSLIGLIGIMTLVATATSIMPYIGRSATGAISASAPASQTQNVKVVNTSAEPMPVQGNATVNGTVQAQQTGTWNVGINGTPVVGLDAANNTVKFDSINNTVKIDTTNPLPVRDVDNPARQPFQTEFLGAEFPDGVAVNFSPLTTVPQGKRLVIEQASVVGGMLLGQKMVQAGIQVSIGNDNNVRHALIVMAQGTSGCCRDVYVASQQVRLYAEAGSSVYGFAIRNTTSGYSNLSVSYSISGYLVDVP